MAIFPRKIVETLNFPLFLAQVEKDQKEINGSVAKLSGYIRAEQESIEIKIIRTPDKIVILALKMPSYYS